MPTAPTGPAKDHPPFQPLAALAAWVVPGAGHFLLGHTRRALLIGAGVLGLFAAGLFIGGISCVDRKENFFWFLGQALTGPVALGVDYVHQTRFKGYDTDDLFSPAGTQLVRNRAELDRLRRRAAFPYETLDRKSLTLSDAGTVSVPVLRAANPANNEGPPYTRSLGRANELGILFCTIAGFLNLICIVDAAWRRRADDPRGMPVAPTSVAAATAGARA